jgi:hypothetical protein
MKHVRLLSTMTAAFVGALFFFIIVRVFGVRLPPDL